MQTVTNWNVRAQGGAACVDDAEMTSHSGESAITVKITREVVRSPSDEDFKQRSEEV